MTKQEIKQKLLSYRQINSECTDIGNRIKQLDGYLEPSATVNTGMPKSSGISNPTELKAENLNQLRELLEKKHGELFKAQMEIEVLIETLDPLERRLCRYRYIEGHTWEEVCVDLNYSWKQTHRIHARILSKLSNNNDIE